MIKIDNLYIILFILPVYQMLFYSVQLITLRKKSDPSRRPLGFLMLLMLLYLVINATRYLGYYQVFSFLYVIQLPVLLGILPTYYLYIQTLTGHTDRRHLKHPLIHYLPSFFILMLNIVALISMNQAQTDLFLTSAELFSAGEDKAIGFAVTVFLLGNAGFMLMQLIITPYYFIQISKKIADTRKHHNAYLPHYQSRWSLIITLSVIVFVTLCSLMNLIIPAYNDILSAIFNIGLLLTGGLAGYLSLNQDKLFIDVANLTTEDIGINENIELPETNTEKGDARQKLALSNEEAKDIISSLQHYIIKNKPYLNGKLGITDLAKGVDISKQKLTYVINSEMGTNFYGLINKYRVLEAKELLVKPENINFNIDIIGEKVGFQSKSSFNACFKKITGLTPSGYRKNKL